MTNHSDDLHRTTRERRTELTRRIQRLQVRISRLQAFSNRVSWLRVLVFVAGLLVAVGIGTQVDALLGWLAFAIGMLFFMLTIAYHRRLERWIDLYALARDMKADELARMNLAWEELPVPANVHATSSLALDLDLLGPRSLHHLLDTTATREASQLLADWLTQTHPIREEILARQALVRELVPLGRFRDRFRLTFRLVLTERTEGENVLRWLDVPFPSRRLQVTLLAATLFVAVNWTLFALSLWAHWPAYWIISLALYLAFYFVSQMSLDSVLDALVRLDAELDSFGAILRYLESFSYSGCPQLAQLCAPFNRPRDAPSALVRRCKLATTAVGLRSNLILGLLLNLVLPWDFFFAFLADRYRAEAARRFPEWLERCFRLDALIALANFAHLNPGYSFPDIVPDAEPAFEAKELGHPLIPHERQVCNDFAIGATGQVAIMTGSNMAGKSTFIKTVGINLCLAYAGAPVNARQLRSLPFRLHTCIRISDSIVDGFSYFYAEVKCLKRLLDELQSQDARPLLYLIDEIFRGTNNRERLLGSRAYLQSCIGANGVGLLATHDLELASLADIYPQVHNYHLRDDVQDGRLVFDYRIRPGPCPTTNALKIMRMEGLPVESDQR
jgi:hypothetical protein